MCNQALPCIRQGTLEHAAQVKHKYQAKSKNIVSAAWVMDNPARAAVLIKHNKGGIYGQNQRHSQEVRIGF